MKLVLEYEAKDEDDRTVLITVPLEAKSVAHVNEALEQLARAALKAGAHEVKAYNTTFSLDQLMLRVPQHKVQEWSARAERGHQMPMVHLDLASGYRRYKRPAVYTLDDWFNVALKRAEVAIQSEDESLA